MREIGGNNVNSNVTNSSNSDIRNNSSNVDVNRSVNSDVNSKANRSDVTVSPALVCDCAKAVIAIVFVTRRRHVVPQCRTQN